MSDAKPNSAPLAAVHAKMIQPRLLRAELRAGRRWTWCGKRGWWLHCSLLNEQDDTWRLCRFVATVSEACTFLNIQEEDWTWQEGAPKPADEKQQTHVPFLMF